MSLTLRSARRLPAAGAGGWRGRPHQEGRHCKRRDE